MKIQFNYVSLAVVGLFSLGATQSAFAMRPVDAEVSDSFMDRLLQQAPKPQPQMVELAQPPSNDPAAAAQDNSQIRTPCNEAQPWLGVRKCTDVKRDAKEYAKKVMGHIMAFYYEGKLLAIDDSASFCVRAETTPYVCNLGNKNAPEEDTNSVNGASCAGEITNNEGYCSIPVAAGFQNCGRELVWMKLGSRIQTWQHHLEEVKKEIDEGKIKLVNYSADPQNPARMCEGYAKSINRLLYGEGRRGALWVDNYIREHFESDKLEVSLADACPRDRAQTSLVGDLRSPASETTPTPAVTALLDQNMSSAACHLSAARQQVESLFFKLAACEVYYRGEKTYHEAFEVSPTPFAAVAEDVVKPCLAYAREKMNVQSDNMSDSSFKNHFYTCYKGQATGKKGVKEVLKEVLDVYAPVDEEVFVKKLDENSQPQACQTVAAVN